MTRVAANERTRKHIVGTLSGDFDWSVLLGGAVRHAIDIEEALEP